MATIESFPSVRDPKPSLKELKVILSSPENKGKTLCPIFIDVLADLETPVSAYLKLRCQGKPSFLLESVAGGENRARYSFIGTDPFKTISTNGQDPTVPLEREMAKHKVIELAGVR